MPRRSRLDREIDDLYQLPLGDFVQARNDLAGRLKERGDVERAAAIRAMAKPNVPAWVVNRLARESRRQVRRLVRAGEKLGRLQREGPAGRGATSLRKALEERRIALAALRSSAERLLAEAGVPANKTTMRRIEATLETVGTWRGARSGLEPGRLTRDLEPSGFDVLFEGPGPTPGSSDKRRSRVQESTKTARQDRLDTLARAAVRRAEKDVARRRVDVERAMRRLSGARKRHEKAESARNAAERKVEKAVTELSNAEQALREARDSRNE